MRNLALGVACAVALAVLSPAAAQAEEVKSKVSPSMILTILSRPIEARESAVLDQRLREDSPASPGEPAGEILSDGSVRYGRTTITVKNPCPPGTLHYEPPPLPGRRAR